MIKFVTLVPLLLISGYLHSQGLEFGMETVTGIARTTFKGELAEMVGFSELEISESEIDSAFASIDVKAPRWLKELFPGLRIEVDETITRKMSRGVSGVRAFARYKWFGGSFTVSSPRLTEPLESQKLKNQVKAIRLSISGKAEELAKHLAKVAIADADRIDPFFSKRYDLEAYLHLKQLFLGEDVLVEWGNNSNNSLDFELTSGIRFTADPSPVVDLGSVLFISEKIDSLMEGGLLDPVENITDAVAQAIQNIVFGKFKDPRIVPSIGWFFRPQLLVNLGGSFSIVTGGEVGFNNHILINGTKPVTSLYAFAGLRWQVFKKK